MSTNQHVLLITSYGDFETDVLPVLKTNQDIMAKVVSHEGRYQTINVAESIAKLATVGELLGVVYMGSKGSISNPQVTTLLADYQTLGKDSQIACQQFLMASVQAIKYHRVAMQLIQRMKPGKAIKILDAISKIADEMSKIAGNLAKRARKMCGLAEQALVVASNDNVISTDRKQQIQRQIADLEARYEQTEAVIANHCTELAHQSNDMKELTDEGLEDLFAEGITYSWYSWLALARTNYNATVAMKAVMAKVDGIVDDLPSTKEIKERLEGAIAKIEKDLALEDNCGSP